jgi:hypothetical protein
MSDSTAPAAMSPEAAMAAERRERWLSRGLLAVACLAVVVFDVASIPHLTNAHFGDVDFTGWSGPLGSRILHGDRPYVDFVLPIPPGSFLLLAGLEKLWGRPLLLQELWLNAATHLGMGILAFVIARAFTSRRTATYVAVTSLLTVIQLNKECAYDHTAQLVAWGSLAAGAHAMVARRTSPRLRLWVLAGALSGWTLLFKQSTGIGSIFGWLAAFVYLAAVDVWSGEPRAAIDWKRPVVRYLQGVGLGLLAVWGTLVLMGSTFRAFFQAVFLDGSILKGGPKFLLRNLAVYLLDFPAYPASMVLIACLVLIGSRWARLAHGSLHVGDEPSRAQRFSAWEGPVLAATLVLGSAAGSFFLFRGAGAYPATWIEHFDRFKFGPPLSLVPACAIFTAHLVKPEGASPDRAGEGGVQGALVGGHRLNAAFVSGLVCSLLHNTSAPEFRPFYDNNAVIPLSLLALFVVLERARLRPLAALFVVALTISVGGNKYFRAMTATTKIESGLHWAGMRVNEHGQEIVKVARRVRELTKPEDTVLILPEDVAMAALIGRPRPPLVGAIVFVDQYAPRLAKDDIARLDEHPPKVIIVHPRSERGWQRFFRIWNGKSGAEEVIQHVLHDLLPHRYQRDSTYRTTFLWEPASLDVWVRQDGGETAK